MAYIERMFIEFDSADFSRISHLFQGRKQYVPVLSVIEGSFPGRVFVDNTREPRTAFVWAIGRWAYIEGALNIPNLDKSLVDLIRGIVIPDSLKIKMNWFELYGGKSPQWMKRLDACLEAFDCRRHFETVYVWDRLRYQRFRSGYSFLPDMVLEISEIPILPPQVCDTPLVSEYFRSRTAIGCRLKAKDKTVALCRSNGFVAGDEFMIDIVTFERDDRGKGYATASGVALLDYCLDHGLAPLWETTEDNAASQRLAEKLGFVANETYPVYAIEF